MLPRAVQAVKRYLEPEDLKVKPGTWGELVPVLARVSRSRTKLHEQLRFSEEKERHAGKRSCTEMKAKQGRVVLRSECGEEVSRYSSEIFMKQRFAREWKNSH